MDTRCIYLAGPGVFRRDAQIYGEMLKQRCVEHGLVPLWPLDNQPAATAPTEIAAELRAMNCAMIRRASALIADISPFRGPNMDPGTAFEIGYAAALGKPVFLYSDTDQTLRDRTERSIATTHADGKVFDGAGMEVEDFGLGENLMIATAALAICDSFDTALAEAATLLAGRQLRDNARDAGR